MKRLIILLAAILLTMPIATAYSFSYTSWGPGFWNLGGDQTQIAYADSDFSAGAYGTQSQWTVYGSDRKPGGFAAGFTVGRETTVGYEAGNDGWHYPTVQHGDWRVERATVNCARCGYGVTAARAPVQPAYADSVSSYGWQAYVDNTNYDRYRNPGTYAAPFTHSRGSFGRDVALGMYGGYGWHHARPSTHQLKSNVGAAQSAYVVPGRNW